MLRRTVTCGSMWAKYQLGVQFPKADGPPPPSAPQNTNDSKSLTWRNPVDDPFPRTIRGNSARPDVPSRHYVPEWFFAFESQISELTPWSVEAPEGAFRFRKHDAFDSAGREMVRKLRSHEATLTEGLPAIQRGSHNVCREPYLSAMDPHGAALKDEGPSLCTIMTRAVNEHLQGVSPPSPVAEQRDSGRVEAPHPVAGKLPVDHQRFPFHWKVPDWYEFEVAQSRLKRFRFENEPGATPHASEVTYKLVIGGVMDHHVHRLAVDLCAFIRDVGRQALEEKLSGLRSSMLGVDTIDPSLRAACNRGNQQYDDEEIAQIARRELEELEESIVRTLALTSKADVSDDDIYDSRQCWPHVEPLESWIRMVEFWTVLGERTFANMEASTRKYEFRRYFRVIKVKMPFHSLEFEKRLNDIRHWLHRHASIEIQTIAKKNIVYDRALYPVEQDPQIAPGHEYHRLFSYALDWEQAPAGWRNVEIVEAGDTWESVATRVGSSVTDLKAANVDVVAFPAAGSYVNVPRGATKRLIGYSAMPEFVSVADKKSTTWEAVAEAVGCSVEDLQAANPQAAATYDKGFHASINQLRLPVTATPQSRGEAFADTEIARVGDSLATIAARTGCAESLLRQANPTLSNGIPPGTHVALPSQSSRRLTHPLLRPQAVTDELLSRLVGEQDMAKLPPHLPRAPEKADQFPGAFRNGEYYPYQPAERPGVEDWMAYTSAYLDRDMQASDPATAVSKNPVWPQYPVPGKMQQTPFEEDQTWLLHRIPAQKTPLEHPDGHIQDLPQINHESYEESLSREAP